jgi:cobalamin biosynthesis protein CobT
MITAVIIAALIQSAAINSQRDNYLACLDKAFADAKAAKMPAEALDAHLRTTCAAIETTFEGALIAFDVKNKVPRKQAAADAQVQVDDFVTSLVDRYRALAARQ